MACVTMQLFSNQAAVADAATVPFDATPVFSNSTGITNAAGDITLPVGGAFLVMYTIRVEIIGNAVGELLQHNYNKEMVLLLQPLPSLQ